MQQKKIIFSLLSLVCSAAFSMENSNLRIMPKGFINCGSGLVKAKWLNDVISGNLIHNPATGQIFVNPIKCKETIKRPSTILALLASSTDGEWKIENNISVRYVYSVNVTDAFLELLNEDVYRPNN